MRLPRGAIVMVVTTLVLLVMLVLSFRLPYSAPTIVGDGLLLAVPTISTAGLVTGSLLLRPRAAALATIQTTAGLLCLGGTLWLLNGSDPDIGAGLAALITQSLLVLAAVITTVVALLAPKPADKTSNAPGRP